MATAQKTVLIVENEIIVADEIAGIVIDLGLLPLFPAFTFTQAVQLFQTTLPDLIILDIRLAGEKSGFEFAEWVYTFKATPIIFVSVNDDLATQVRAKLMNSFGYITKPFEANELKNCVLEALRI